eukprot:363403-Chlamydomonas_euryale.AAC.30
MHDGADMDELDALDRWDGHLGWLGWMDVGWIEGVSGGERKEGRGEGAEDRILRHEPWSRCPSCSCFVLKALALSRCQPSVVRHVGTITTNESGRGAAGPASACVQSVAGDLHASARKHTGGGEKELIGAWAVRLGVGAGVGVHRRE